MPKKRNLNDGKFETSHGLSRTPEYKAWQSMKYRCLNENCHAFVNYGGRGITMHERWASFTEFFADVGPRPGSEYSLDRVNNEGNYEPGNVRWATRTQQARNRRDVSDKIRAALTGRPHYERHRYVCQCGLTTNAGPMAGHQRKTGHSTSEVIEVGVIRDQFVTRDPLARYAGGDKPEAV